MPLLDALLSNLISSNWILVESRANNGECWLHYYLRTPCSIYGSPETHVTKFDELRIKISQKIHFDLTWNNDHIRSLISTCHDSWAVVTCAKWPDLTIRMKTETFEYFNYELEKSLLWWVCVDIRYQEVVMSLLLGHLCLAKLVIDPLDTNLGH